MDKRKKVVHYHDSLNDDFSGMHFEKKKFNSDYKYISHNPFIFLLGKFLMIFIAIPLFFILGKCRYRITYKNRRAIKSLKKSGYYIYSNHTIILDPAYDVVMVEPFRKSIIIASRESFNINPIVTGLIRCLGGIPVPIKGDEVMEKNYYDCLSYNVKKKHHNVILYPERHIWAYYNDIRPFTTGQFRYPVNDDAPSFAFTKTFVKTKFRKLPKIVVYISGPFYPDKSLPYEERVNKLRDDVYNAMKLSIKEHGSYEYVKYVKD